MAKVTTQRRAEAYWKESTGRWQINVQKDGIRKTFNSTLPGRKGKHECENKADEWLATGESEMRLQAAWESYIKWMRTTMAATSIKCTESAGNRYILPTLGNKSLSRISPAAWQSVIDNAVSTRGLSEASCKSLAVKITSFLKYCKRNRWACESLRTSDFRIPRKPSSRPPRKALDPTELHTLMTVDTERHYTGVRKAHWIYAYRFLVFTGLRRGELIALTNDDITEDGYIHVRHSVNRFGETVYGKTKNAIRTFKLCPEALETLADQRRYLESIGIISPYVFPDPHGNRTASYTLYANWHRYCEYNGIEACLHELRHTYISICKADVPIELLKQVVGHGVSMATISVYGHEVVGDADRAANASHTAFSNILQSISSND